MHVLSIPCLVMASINFYVALYYFFLYFKKTKIAEHLPFAVLCLSIGFYDVFCVGLYNSLSVGEGIFWQRLQLYVINLSAISMLWFSFIFTGHRNKRVLYFFVAWFLAIFAVSVFIDPAYFVSAAKPSIKHAGFMGIMIDYYEAETGPVCNVEFVSIIAAYIYSLYVFLAYYAKTRDKIIIILIAGLFIFFFGVLNDILVPMGLYPFIYVSEYAFFFIVMAMAYILLNKFADLQTAFEELNANLERKIAERTEENINIQARLLQSEKMAAVGQLTSGLAHEINNPVGVILGFSQGLIKRIKEDDQFYKPLKSIEKEATRCKKLVTELLVFSRTGKTHSENTAINALIEETLDFVGAQAADRNIRIEKKYDPALKEITVNKNQIQQVLVNICNNAMDAMPDGGVISIATRQDGNRAEIEIADTGKGMTQEVLKHIFEPFFTTKEVGKGTGLGLSMCYEIVNNHHGSIGVKTEVDKGSVFTVNLPANTTAEQETEKWNKNQ